MGLGVLWARREILEDMPPFLGGGEMIRQVTLDGSTYASPPARFEAGTPPVAEAVGLAAALDYLDALGMEAVHAHARAMTDAACAALEAVPGLTHYGPCVDRGPAIAFTLDGVHPHDLATILDTQGVAVRAGHHCTQPLHRRYGLSATARASFYIYNTLEDLDALVAALHEARARVRPGIVVCQPWFVTSGASPVAQAPSDKRRVTADYQAAAAGPGATSTNTKGSFDPPWPPRPTSPPLPPPTWRQAPCAGSGPLAVTCW